MPRPRSLTELTPKEREIIPLVADGLTNPEIAERLGVSPKAIEGRLTSVYGKTEVSNRTQLAIHAQRNGWLDPDSI